MVTLFVARKYYACCAKYRTTQRANSDDRDICHELMFLVRRSNPRFKDQSVRVPVYISNVNSRLTVVQNMHTFR